MQQCPICMEAVKSTQTHKSVRLKCNHSIHRECWYEYLKHCKDPICPTCRTDCSDESAAAMKLACEDKVRYMYLEVIASMDVD